MPRLTKQQIEWWDAQPQEQICQDCGTRGSKAYVQPQYPDGHALCVDCIVKRNERYRAERKRQLAAMPRCEFCNHRATWKAGAGPNPALLCGRHLNKAKREHATHGIMGLLHLTTGDDVRAMIGGVA